MRQLWTTAVRRLWTWLVREVPPEIAACEFECRKLDCSVGEWLTCERRLAIFRSISADST